jgi:hypothetical protein
MWQLQAGYAAVAVVIDVISGRPFAAMAPNGWIVLASVAIAAANLWWYRRRLFGTFATPALAAGATALLLFVVNHNLGQPLSPSLDLEPLGVLAFVAALGYAVIGHVFRGEAELLAVRHELETARQIQRSLLPREPPQLHGLDLGVRYLPVSAVAGDLYDFAVLGPSTLGIWSRTSRATVCRPRSSRRWSSWRLPRR